eukprot:1523434-Pleurochrysis_carterae.AAC.1
MQWHLAGLPVPAGYASPAGQPACPSAQAYQLQRGPGDRRCIPAVTPTLASSSAETARAEGIDTSSLGAAVP